MKIPQPRVDTECDGGGNLSNCLKVERSPTQTRSTKDKQQQFIKGGWGVSLKVVKNINFHNIVRYASCMQKSKGSTMQCVAMIQLKIEQVQNR